MKNKLYHCPDLWIDVEAKNKTEVRKRLKKCIALLKKQGVILGEKGMNNPKFITIWRQYF